jgi:hypothetical protein
LREYLPIRIFFQHKLTVIVNEGGEELFFVIPCENFLSTVYFSTGEAYIGKKNISKFTVN